MGKPLAIAFLFGREGEGEEDPWIMICKSFVNVGEIANAEI